MEEVSLSMMLECRENRARTQRELISMYGKPVVSFTMNIAGPVKTNRLIERGFSIGVERLLGALLCRKATVMYKRTNFLTTGPEGFFVVDMDPCRLKSICKWIEEMDPLGRLFDMDVIDVDGKKVERKDHRHCLICNEPAKICSSRRIHAIEDVWNRTNEILTEAVLQHDSNAVAAMAVKALLFEVLTTPKPGLVDRRNNGSHTDMDLFTFSSSASVLFPYFKKAYSLGWRSVDLKKCFAELREFGKDAEHTMFFETNGVNTHKGAIFSLGIVCCAAGFTAMNGGDVFQCCALMTKGTTDELKDGSQMETNGKRLFAKYGLRGIRGELEDGLPSVRNIGLPMLEEYLEKGLSLEEAGSRVLIALVSQLSDTNMIARGGKEKADEAMKMAADLLSSDSFGPLDIEKLDEYFISQNLSPGGSADLLAVCFFLHFLKERFNV